MDIEKPILLATGIGGAIFTTLVFTSPVIQVIRLCKTKDPSTVSEIVFIGSELTSMFWFVRFYRVWDFLALFPHFFSLPSNITFFSIFIFYKFTRKLTQALMLIGTWTFVTGVMIALLFGVPDTEKANTIIGYIAMVINVLLALTPLQKITKVIKTRNYRIIQVSFDVLLLFSAICWLIYAYVKGYIPLLVPQVAIIVLSVFAILVYLWCRFKYGSQKGEESEKKANSPRKESKSTNDIDSGRKRTGSIEMMQRNPNKSMMKINGGLPVVKPVPYLDVEAYNSQKYENADNRAEKQKEGFKVVIEVE